MPRASLLQLPEELRLRVVEYITLKSDLKSLCETCSALRVVANPLLYRRIILRLWSRRAVDRLQKSNLAGAGLHFQHTKELIIEDSPPGEELFTIHSGRIRPPLLDRRVDAHYLNAYEKDNYAYSFLQIMHHHQLERLWYHSRRRLSPVVKTHLRNYQTKIQDLQIGLYTDPGSPKVLPRIFCGLQRLDLYLTDFNGSETSSIILLFDNIEAVGANLKSLSLTGESYMDINGPLDAWAMGEENDFTRFTPKLEELTLFNFAFDDAFEGLSLIVNFHRLVRLKLLGSYGGAQDFFFNLAKSTKGKKLRLKHIAIELAGDMSPSGGETLKDSLKQIFRASEPIESFHIRCDEADPDESFTYTYLEDLHRAGHDLQSLSFHANQYNRGEYDSDAANLLLEIGQDFSFHGLKQLAIYFEEQSMLSGIWGTEGFEPMLITALSRFPELRLLHLRLPHCVRMGCAEQGGVWDTSILVLQLQTFASRIFESLNAEVLRNTGAESKLDALVIGHVATLGDPDNLDLVRPLPQQCFVRGEQRDILGRTVPVAVPVTRMMLRETQPYTDILEVDVHSASDAWEVWAARPM